MHKIENLKEDLKLLQTEFGQKYFIFIAPFDLPKCQELRIFEDYVYNKILPPDIILADIDQLDIYFVEYDKIPGMKEGRPLAFRRLSTTEKTNL